MLWASKIARVLVSGILGFLTKWHLDVVPMVNHREYYKGEGGSPSLSCGEFYESLYARGSSMHQKCSNYVLTNLLFGLCRSVWIIDPLIIHLNFHFRTSARPSTHEVLWIREHTFTFSPSVVFTFGLTIESIQCKRIKHVCIDHACMCSPWHLELMCRDQFFRNNNFSAFIVGRHKNFSEEQQQKFIIILRFAATIAPH